MINSSINPSVSNEQSAYYLPMPPRPKLRITASWMFASISVLIFAIWLSSYFAVLTASTKTESVSIYHGRLSLWRSDGKINFPLAITLHWIPTKDRLFQWGFWFDDVGTRPLTRYYLPLWAPFALTSICAIVFRIVGFHSWFRARGNRCPTCGYDQSGLPPDAKCPECGKDAQIVDASSPRSASP